MNRNLRRRGQVSDKRQLECGSEDSEVGSDTTHTLPGARNVLDTSLIYWLTCRLINTPTKNFVETFMDDITLQLSSTAF